MVDLNGSPSFFLFNGHDVVTSVQDKNRTCH